MNNGADCASIRPVSGGSVLTVELPKSRNFCPLPDRRRRQRGQFSDILPQSQAGRDSSLTVSEGRGFSNCGGTNFRLKTLLNLTF